MDKTNTGMRVTYYTRTFEQTHIRKHITHVVIWNICNYEKRHFAAINVWDSHVIKQNLIKK